MPYVRCACCGLSGYTAGRWSTVEPCARCGNELRRPRREADQSFGLASLDRPIAAANLSAVRVGLPRDR